MAKCPEVGEGEFKLVLPLADNSGRKIKHTEYSKYIKEINDYFGGNTSFRAGGCFIKDEKPQCEGNAVMTAFRDFENPYDKISKKNWSCGKRKKQLENDYGFVKHLAKRARDEFGQDGVTALWVNIRDATIIRKKREPEKGWKESISRKKTKWTLKKFGMKDIF